MLLFMSGFIRNFGLWFGATPETLLTISDYQFTTMSLAGTQVLF